MRYKMSICDNSSVINGLNAASKDNDFNKATSKKEVNKIFPVSKNLLDHFEKNVVKPLEKLMVQILLLLKNLMVK